MENYIDLTQYSKELQGNKYEVRIRVGKFISLLSIFIDNEITNLIDDALTGFRYEVINNLKNIPLKTIEEELLDVNLENIDKVLELEYKKIRRSILKILSSCY